MTFTSSLRFLYITLPIWPTVGHASFPQKPVVKYIKGNIHICIMSTPLLNFNEQFLAVLIQSKKNYLPYTKVFLSLE